MDDFIEAELSNIVGKKKDEAPDSYGGGNIEDPPTASPQVAAQSGITKKLTLKPFDIKKGGLKAMPSRPNIGGGAPAQTPDDQFNVEDSGTYLG